MRHDWEPCCAAHAQDDICVVCQCAIATDETRYYGERQTCRQTFWSPAEYECSGPFCGQCWLAEENRAAQDEEARSLHGLTKRGNQRQGTLDARR